MNHHSSQVTGKELLFKALRHEPLPATPWVPFAGVHAGSLKGYSGSQILTDKNKLLESLLEVNRQYDPDGQPVVFDLQIEAEILGCELVWADKAPPSVASHPLSLTTELPTRLPERTDGRLPMVLDTMRSMKGQVGEHTALYGLVTGPFTLASHLRGTEIFMDMFDRKEYLVRLLSFCTSVAIRMSDLYREAGMDVIAVVDPLVSQISPKHFSQFLSNEFLATFLAIFTSLAFFLLFLSAVMPPRTLRSCAKHRQIASLLMKISTWPMQSRSPIDTISPSRAISLLQHACYSALSRII